MYYVYSLHSNAYVCLFKENMHEDREKVEEGQSYIKNQNNVNAHVDLSSISHEKKKVIGPIFYSSAAQESSIF